MDTSRKAAIVGVVLAVTKLGLHIYANLLDHYEFHRDEFLYFAMGENLRLFSMDFPPFIAILSEVTRGLLGDGMLGIRLPPMLAGLAVMMIAMLTAQTLGGRAFAQGLAGLSMLSSVLFLRASNLFQPVVFDQLWWSIALFALLKLGLTDDRKWWLWFAGAMGIGLLTKFSILILGLAVLIGLVATSQRRWLATPWPWAAAAIALLIGSPSIIGQINLGWPVFGQMEAIGVQFEQVSYGSFIIEQIQMVGGFFVAIVGAWVLISERLGPGTRLAGIVPVVAFLTLLLLHGKAYYAGPIYPVLLGAGAVAIERIAHRWTGPVLRWGLVGGLAVYFVVLLPISLPIVPPANLEKYLIRLGVQEEAATTNVGDHVRIPQDFADMLNWKMQAIAVSAVYANLSDEGKKRAVVLASNYGEAGAVSFYGPRFDLPRPARAYVGSFWYFGPGELPGDIIITLGFDREELEPHFETIRHKLNVGHPFAVGEERDVPIFLVGDADQTLQEWWPSLEGRH